MLPERGGKQQLQQLSQKVPVNKKQASSVLESEGPRTAPKGTNHPAWLEPATSRSPIRASRRPPPHPPTSPHTTGRPRSRSKPRHRLTKPLAHAEIALQRQLRAPPKLALYPLPALAPRCTHHEQPCSQASGGEQPSLPPPRRGATAPSSPPSPVISRLICAPQ
jgi:hypothetical protein